MQIAPKLQLLSGVVVDYQGHAGQGQSHHDRMESLSMNISNEQLLINTCNCFLVKFYTLW